MEGTGKVVDRRAAVAGRLVELVDAYARRVYPAVLEQHDAESVCSPLGVRLLLAACASAAEGEDRRALERSLGCPADQAVESLGLWVRAADATQEVREWARGLPRRSRRG